MQLPGRHQCLAAIYTALAAGASLTAHDKDGLNALHLAARYNPDAEAVAAAIAALVEEGANVNAQTRGKITALHLAAVNPNAAAAVAAVRVLAAPTVIPITCGGVGPLHWMAFQTSAEAVPAVVQALVAAGFSPNAGDLIGITPLVSEAMHAWAARGAWLLLRRARPAASSLARWYVVHFICVRIIAISRHASALLNPAALGSTAQQRGSGGGSCGSTCSSGC